MHMSSTQNGSSKRSCCTYEKLLLLVSENKAEASHICITMFELRLVAQLSRSFLALLHGPCCLALSKKTDGGNLVPHLQEQLTLTGTAGCGATCTSCCALVSLFM